VPGDATEHLNKNETPLPTSAAPFMNHLFHLGSGEGQIGDYHIVLIPSGAVIGDGNHRYSGDFLDFISHGFGDQSCTAERGAGLDKKGEVVMPV